MDPRSSLATGSESATTDPWRAFRPDEFAGRVALVTGAGGGMGLATAQAFAGCGAEVVLTDLAGPALTRASAQLPDALALPTDITDADAVAYLFERIDEVHGRVDHVAHTAAVLTAQGFLEADAAHWRRVLDINLVGAFTVAQQAIRRMLARGAGTIVLVASDAGYRGAGHEIADAPYAASKAGVLSLVKSMAREFAGQGVRINALAPGASDTPLLGGLSAELKQQIAQWTPMQRLGDPADMAAAILYLSSGAASFVYGAALDVDGGAMFR